MIAEKLELVGVVFALRAVRRKSASNSLTDRSWCSEEVDCDGEERRNDAGATDGGLEYLSWCRFLGITDQN